MARPLGARRDSAQHLVEAGRVLGQEHEHFTAVDVEALLASEGGLERVERAPDRIVGQPKGDR